MRAVLSLLAVVLALAGCGSGDAGVGGPGSTSQTPDTGTSAPGDEINPGDPPPVFLESAAGRQRAVPGSSCVAYPDPSSDEVGIVSCADGMDPSPESLNVVRPGEEIRILLEDADVVRSDGCFGADDEQECIGTGHVHALGCGKKPIAEIPFSLGPVTTWSVDLAPGAYELDFFVYFSASGGRGGDFSGALGLLVDDTAPLEVVPTPGSVIGCIGPDPVREP